ncbi:RNA polymerase-associated protein RapA [Gallaecimonas sp. GXIMD4217]|uniref:RNA polymerase-associated protein RapA n=1 Tax=Gallaecimonas sp. GXIMD4217 TaxID=3131927 RepID=UPI00311B1C13
MPFALGQRWIADAESDLGLGTLVALDARTVSLLFPACGENRVYTRQDAPITRVRFNPGDRVTSHEDWQLTVEEIEEQDGLVSYVGIREDTQERLSLRETFLSHVISINKPQDRLFAGQVDRNDWFTLRYQTLEQQSRLSQSPLRGLVGQRADLIPHQLHIANEVGRRMNPRVLLADEVGLGKTVEAGMIIHQQLLAGRASRVLLLVPDSLMHQWLVEMLRRFNLRFALFDEERLQEASLDVDNPFDTEQLVLISLDLIAKRKQRFEQVLEADWDMLVVDEAHHLAWHPDKPSREYQVVEALAEEVPSVLLLTATPDQLGHESHFARLRLLDPERFHDYESFKAEEQDYRQLAEAAARILAGEALTDEDKTIIAAQGDDLAELAGQLDDPACRDQLVAALIDRHGTSRVLLRNTRAAVPGFPGRALHEVPLAMPEAYGTAIKVSRMMAGRKGTEEQARELLYPERIYQDFEGSEEASWCQHDPRALWLLDFLAGHRDEKVVLICAQASQALALAEFLRSREAVNTAVFHEGMSIVERDRAAAYFADSEDGAQILLCSEIGSEGRNFQFARHLVLFDLPLNPDLLEQRIGRLDRIGQKFEVAIHVPHFQDSAQAMLLAWYHQGLNAFESTCPAGSQLFDEFGERLLACLASQEQADLAELTAETAQRRQALEADLESGRDRLLELASGGRGRGESLVQAIAEQDFSHHLPTYLLQLLDVFGVDQEDLDDETLLLRPSEHMLSPLPGLEEDGQLATFGRERALSRDDIQFLSWDHPLVTGTMEAVLSGDMGNAAVALLKNKALPAGTLFVELVYISEHQAPKHLQLDRFLPPTPIRLLLDKNGKDLSANVPFDQFNRQLTPLKRHTAAKLASASQAAVHGLISQAESGLAGRQAELIARARETAGQVLDGDLARLEALKAVNASIRDDELEELRAHKSAILTQIDRAQLKLDMVRLIVVVNE